MIWLKNWVHILSKPTQFERVLDYKFKNRRLFRQSFRHRSVTKNRNQNNERLEYLGDAVLGLVLGDALMKKYPRAEEGVLSKMRSSLVSTKGLSKKAQELNILEYLPSNDEKQKMEFQNNIRLMASFFEAIVGAIYLDGGYKRAQKVVSQLFQQELNQEWVDEDYKTLLQEKSQKLFQQIPDYELIEELGPAHKKTFVIQVSVNNEVLGVGQSSTKKEAEQIASQQALEKLNDIR